MTEKATDPDAREQHASADEPAKGPVTQTQEAAMPQDEPHADDVEALRREAEENWSKYLRAVADLDNLRKRNAREIENARKYGTERLAQAVLPVRDSLEAALGVPDTVDVASVLEGDRATLRLLDQALESAGIREIDPQGEAFDPTRHEAMTVQPTTEVPPDTVVMVIQKGYELNDRLLRPARVIVASAPPDAN